VKREPCILLDWFVPDNQKSPNAGLLITQLDNAGLVHVVKTTDKEEGTYFLLELRCPRGPYDLRQWADMNSLRIQSFGLNAHASWKEIP